MLDSIKPQDRKRWELSYGEEWLGPVLPERTQELHLHGLQRVQGKGGTQEQHELKQ